MTDLLTYLMTYTGRGADDIAAVAALFLVTASLIGMIVVMYIDAARDIAIVKYGAKSVHYANPDHYTRISWVQIIGGTVIFLSGLYIALWYCDHVPDNSFQDWFGWITILWKSFY